MAHSLGVSVVVVEGIVVIVVVIVEEQEILIIDVTTDQKTPGFLMGSLQWSVVDSRHLPLAP